MAKLIPLTTLPPTVELWEGYHRSKDILLYTVGEYAYVGSYSESFYEDGSTEYTWRTRCMNAIDLSDVMLGWLELPTIEY